MLGTMPAVTRLSLLLTLCALCALVLLAAGCWAARGPRRHVRQPALLLAGLALALPPLTALLAPMQRLNPDTYLYWSLATRWLHQPTDLAAVDAFTVGPLVPIALALWRVLTGLVAVDDPLRITQAAVALQALAYASCVLLAFRVGVRQRQGWHACRLAPPTAWYALLIVVLLSFWVALPWRLLDTFSFNGEGLSIAFLAALLALAQDPAGRRQMLARALLAALVLHVKLQAAPLALLALLWRDRGLQRLRLGLLGLRSERLQLLLMTGVAVVLIDALLALAGGMPLLGKLQGLQSYLLHDAQSNAPRAWRPPGDMAAQALAHGQWLLWALMSYLAVPLGLLLAMVPTAWMDPRRRALVLALRGMLVWMALALGCVLVPMRAFEHYLVLALPVLVLLTPALRAAWRCARATLSLAAAAQPWAVLAMVLALTLLVRHQPDPMRPSEPDWAEAERARYAEVRQFVHAHPGRYQVHGWDYSIHAYTGTWRAVDPGLDVVYSSGVWSSSVACRYVREVAAGQADYVIDAVSAGVGLLQQTAHRIASHPQALAVLTAAYEPVPGTARFPIWRRRADAPPAAALPACD